MKKKQYNKIIRFANSLGIKVTTKYFFRRRTFKLAQAWCTGNEIVVRVQKRKWKNNYINWTDAIFDLCHEIGHYLYDLNNPAPIMSDKAYSYMPANNNDKCLYMPKKYRGYVYREEYAATEFITSILEYLDIKFSERKYYQYLFDVLYMYDFSLHNCGKDTTYKDMKLARKEFKRIYDAE